MKLFYYFIIIVFIFQLTLLSKDCGETTHCPNRKYSYTVYDKITDSMILKCLDDPNNDPNSIPYKAKLPICISFVNSGPSIPVSTGSAAGYRIETYNIDYLTNDIDASTYKWNCLCNTFSGCGCTIIVKFQTNPKYFVTKSGSQAQARTFQYAKINLDEETLIPSCGIDDPTKSTVIYLNDSKEFTGDDPASSIKHNFFVNQHYFDDNLNYLNQLKTFCPDCEAFNIRDIITHELGHTLGLGHYTDDSGHLICDTEGSGLMDDGSVADFEQSSQNLSNDDICFFKKLYCPSSVPVEEDIQPLSDSKIFPNPIFSHSSIEFSIINENEVVSIDIFNTIGECIYKLIDKKIFSFGKHSISLKSNDFVSGKYYYKIIIGKQFEVKSFLVIKN